MLNLSSFTEEQWQTSHDVVVCKVEVIKSSANMEVPMNSSKTKCKISATSCWVLKLKSGSREDILCCRALRKLDGSIGDEARFRIDIFKDTALSNGDLQGPSDGDCDHKAGIVLKACSIEFLF